jgi:hypothetical protein
MRNYSELFSPIHEIIIGPSQQHPFYEDNTPLMYVQPWFTPFVALRQMHAVACYLQSEMRVKHCALKPFEPAACRTPVPCCNYATGGGSGRVRPRIARTLDYSDKNNRDRRVATQTTPGLQGARVGRRDWVVQLLSKHIMTLWDGFCHSRNHRVWVFWTWAVGSKTSEIVDASRIIALPFLFAAPLWVCETPQFVISFLIPSVYM